MDIRFSIDNTLVGVAWAVAVFLIAGMAIARRK